MRGLNQMRIEKARRDALKRMREEMGYPAPDATELGLSAIVKREVSWVREVEWKTLDTLPMLAVARLRLRWWAWLLFPVLHFVALRRARILIERYKAAGVTVLVGVWG